ncbi:MAG: hypothetical protein M0P01_14740 [Treponema sp.]|nr:hypothetical protein [Treponema sp.]
MKKSIFLFPAAAVLAGAFSPYPLSSEVREVKTGVYIVSLDNFDYDRNCFSATFWVWGFLTSEEIKKTYTEGLDFISANSINKDVEGSVSFDRGNLVQQKYKAEIRHTWDMKNYPFIRDILSIDMENLSDISLFRFIPDIEQSGISDSYTNSEWNVDGFSTSVSNHTYNTNYGDRGPGSEGKKYSRLRVNIAISKKSPWITFFKLTASVYLFFLLSLLPFCMNPDTDSRISIPCATLFAVVTNQNIVDSMVPSSTSITLLDSIHSITQIMIVCIIAVLIVTNNLQIQNDLAAKKRGHLYDRKALVTLPVLYTGANIVLLCQYLL